jgi:hypothetical protein
MRSLNLARKKITSGNAFARTATSMRFQQLKPVTPWAVHSAKTYEKLAGKDGLLTPRQVEILRLLKSEGAMEPTRLLKKLAGNLQFKDLEREFATLRHMEKVRGEKQGRKVLWRLW